MDHVARVEWLLELGFSRRAVDHRLSTGQWRRLLPGVILTTIGEISRRQRLAAALAWAGDSAAIDGIDACFHYGLRSSPPHPRLVQIATNKGDLPRSRDFVVVRRQTRPLQVRRTDMLRYVTPADAVVAAARRMTSQRQITALFSEAVQQRVVSADELLTSHLAGSPRGRKLCDAALDAVIGGSRSAPEAEVRSLMLSAPALLSVVFNRLLRLPTGRIVSPDALLTDSGVVHETNGRKWHAAEDRFDSMQERHDAMTECGLIVLHNSPRRIMAEPAAVLGQIERTHALYAGRGLPPGVELLPAECELSTF